MRRRVDQIGGGEASRRIPRLGWARRPGRVVIPLGIGVAGEEQAAARAAALRRPLAGRPALRGDEREAAAAQQSSEVRHACRAQNFRFVLQSSMPAGSLPVGVLPAFRTRSRWILNTLSLALAVLCPRALCSFFAAGFAAC